MDYSNVAKKMVLNGICPIPLKRTSKKPMIKWGKFKDKLPTDAELKEHYSDCDALGACTLLGQDEDSVLSDLFLLDFDLKYQLEDQDYFKAFMDQIPKEIKKKFLVNKSWSGTGRHVWMRTKDYYDKSRKLAYRLKTIDELYDDKERIMLSGGTSRGADISLLSAPYAVVIETRAANSYGVLVGEGIERVYGKKLNYFSKDEMELIIAAAYSTSDYFQKKEVFSGNPKAFGVIESFNDDSSPSDILQMLESTGMFKYVRTNNKGDISFLRIGSNAPSSGTIFGDRSIVKLFSQNTIFGDCKPMNPYQLLKKINNFTDKQAIKYITKNK